MKTLVFYRLRDGTSAKIAEDIRKKDMESLTSLFEVLDDDEVSSLFDIMNNLNNYLILKHDIARN
jgi:menaquinone-dependent protoporphyrinogen IX oxidase